MKKEGSTEAAREFLRSCLITSPQNRFSYMLDREYIDANSKLKESLGESLIQFDSDLKRWNWSTENSQELFDRLLLAPNLQVVYFYRLNHALFVRGVKLFPDVIAALSRWMTGVEIYYSAKIGPGLKVIHGIGTVIGAHSQIGSNFTVYQGVTIGDKLGKQTGLDKRPQIGDYVVACAGTSIIGPVTIGEKTIIGINSVVLDSLPDRCIATGSPAVIKERNLSDERFNEFWTAFRG
jgi:serine acetyltransferase